MTFDRKALGHVIGCLRARRAMSQETLSGLAGISRSHLAMIENGHKTARIDTLWYLAAALGIRLSDLVYALEMELLHDPDNQRLF